MGRQKFLDVTTRDAVLDGLGRCRRSMIDVRRSLSTRTMLYREAGHLMDQIDEMALLITGEREYFWTPPHSTS